MIKSVNILLLSSEGDLFLRVHEGSAGIADSGKVITFGGDVVIGETPRTAAVRQMKEQADLDVAPYKLLFSGTSYQRSEDSEMHLFVLENVDPMYLCMSPGQRLVVISAGDDLQEISFSTLCRGLVRDFFEKSSSK